MELILLTALLGLVQGVCEFLPVSSSGHLVLLQTVFGINEGALFLDTMLHVGTLIAVFVAFRKQIWALIKHPFQKKVGLLLIATAVTTVIAVLFKDVFEGSYSGNLLGFGFIVTGIILVLMDRLAKDGKPIEKLSLGGAAGVGLMQGIAIFPGISRSGSTIAGSRLFGLSKSEAAEFSFILSIPAILGSVVLQLPDVIREGVQGISWAAIITGTIVAAVSGYFAIRFMLRIILKKSFKGFAVYVFILGILVLADQFIFNIFFAKPF